MSGAAQPRSALPKTFQPLLYAACAFGAGVIFATYQWRPALWLAAACIALLIGAGVLLHRSPHLAGALVLLAFAALGALATQAPGPTAPDLLRFSGGEPVRLIGTVMREGDVAEGYYGGLRQVFDVEVEEITAGGQAQRVSGGARISVYLRDQEKSEEGELPPVTAMRLYRDGERVQLTARLRPPRNYGNPGSFDYREYLAARGIVVLGSGNAADARLLAPAESSPLSWRSALRRDLRERMQRLWPGEDAGLLGAMLLGDRAHITRDTRRDFQRTGVYHVLVVSGMQVGILAVVLMWGWRRLRVSHIPATLLTIAGCAGFAFLVDSGAPVVRAAITVSVYLVTRLVYRERMPLNAIGAAALAMLVLEPRGLFDASLQLTFVAVLAIAGIGVPLAQRTVFPYRRGLRYFDSLTYDTTLPPRVAQFRVELRMLLSRLERIFGRTLPQPVLVGGSRWALATAELVIVTAVVQLAMALPMAYYFHRASLVSLPSNLLVTPLTMLLLPLSMIALAVSAISSSLADVFAPVVGLVLWAIATAVELFGGMRSAEIRVATPGALIAVFAAAVAVLAMLAVRRGRLLAWAGFSLLAAAAVAIALLRPAPQLRPHTLEITALDVGQGDALLVATPQGKLLLIDGGGSSAGRRSEFDFGEEVVGPYLWSRGITRLDAIALTHAHSDHIGGLASVIDNFRPHELWVGLTPDIPAARELIARARASGVRVMARQAGEQFDFGGTRVRVLAPVAGQQAGKRPSNNDSLALHFTHGRTSALLPGDIEKKIEQAIAPELLPADVLKVPHHGSATSTNDVLLDAVRPRFAVVSSGARNPFGHPRADVLTRLRVHQVRTWRTDIAGAISFYLDGEKVEVRLPARPR